MQFVKADENDSVESFNVFTDDDTNDNHPFAVVDHDLDTILHGWHLYMVFGDRYVFFGSYNFRDSVENVISEMIDHMR